MTAEKIPTNDSNFKSQFGEDRLLYEYFHEKKAGYYVEVGACDGIYASNTFFFERLGWRGLLIEPIPELAERCRNTRPNSQVICSAAVSPNSPDHIEFEVVEGWEALSSVSLKRDRFYDYQPNVRKISVSARTLDAMLEEAKAPPVDFLTIDVEGQEWQVLQGFTISRWQPEIIILERWSPVPDQRVMDYMHRNTYVYKRTTGGLNDWFYRSGREESNSIGYRLWLFLHLYLPAYTVRALKTGGKLLIHRPPS
jgi:FkbM family methyltransferase